MQLKQDNSKMEIKIIEEIKNELFNRNEIKGEVSLNSTPQNSEVLKALADKFKVSEDNIKVKGIYGKFGSQNFEIIANIYSTKEDKDKTEQKTKQEKEAEKKAEEERIKAEKEAREAAKAEEEAKKAEAEKAAEKPQEETKEEVKEEVKEESAQEKTEENEEKKE